MDCKERYYEKIVKITAYPLDAVTFSLPFQLIGKGITSTGFSLDDSRKIDVPMEKDTAVLKDSVLLDVSGMSYEVTMTWQIEEVTNEVCNTLEYLRDKVCHFMVTSFGENEVIIRSVEYAYDFSFYEADGKYNCELKVYNVNGVQRVL